VAATGICGFSLTETQLLAACAEVEGHADNVAAALHGGVVLVVAGGTQHVVPLSVARGLTLVFAVPDFEVTTRAARAVLPRAVPHAVATQAAARAAARVHGLATGEGDVLRAALDDVLHVPYRRALIDGYDAVCGAAVSAGAFGATLSGSGSTLVAIAPERQAPAVAEAMRTAWQAHGVATDAFVNAAQVEGRHLVLHQDCEDVPAGAVA
jgi:homoserine kinase